MARFARKSKEEMLKELAIAEAEGSDGLEGKIGRSSSPVSMPPSQPVSAPTPVVFEEAPLRTVEPEQEEEITFEEFSFEEPAAPEKPHFSPEPPPTNRPEPTQETFGNFETFEMGTQEAEEKDSCLDFNEIPLSLDDNPSLQTDNVEVEKPEPARAQREDIPVATPRPSAPPSPQSTPTNGPDFSRVKIPTHKETPKATVQQREKTRAKERASVSRSAAMEDLQLARLVIKLYDAISKLSQEERETAAMFISSEEGISDDYAKFAIAAINVDKMLAPTLSALTQAKEFDAVNRAFYVMGLENDLLESVGKLSEVLSGSSITKNISDKIGYSREIVNIVEELQEEAISYVEATAYIVSLAEND